MYIVLCTVYINIALSKDVRKKESHLPNGFSLCFAAKGYKYPFEGTLSIMVSLIISQFNCEIKCGKQIIMNIYKLFTVKQKEKPTPKGRL